MTVETPVQGRRGRLGKYEVLAHIATGGMGAVYKALDTEADRYVALKVLSPEMAARPAVRERFQREAQSARKLHHENIVAFHEAGEINDTLFLALEFVDGIDLHHYVVEHGPLPPEHARAILTQAARALAHLHSQGIVHRDVKPSNLLIARQNGRLIVKLTDLGLAREHGETDARVTRIGSTVGTIDYMSPEQARDSGKADIRSDLYSLGCTLYHVLAGHGPFAEGSLVERVRQHAEEEPADIRRLRPETPADLVAILHRLLRKQPDDRYQTPDALLDALGESPRETPRMGVLVASPPKKPTADLKARGHRPQPRLPKPRSQSPEPITGRRGWRPWLAGVALVGVVTVGVVVLLNMDLGLFPADTEEAETTPPPVQQAEHVEKKPVVKPVPQVEKPEPVAEKVLPRVFSKWLPLDRAALCQEFEGPLANYPEPPKDAMTLRVRRAGGAHFLRSLAEAWENLTAQRATVIEIHDDGPLLVGPLPPLVQRDIVLRAAPGYRPLLVWDMATEPGGVLLALKKGQLILEGLDVEFRGAESEKLPAVLCQVTDGDFATRDCSFTCALEPAQGLAVVRLQGTATARLVRCFGRGTDLTAVRVAGTGAEVLIDGCLFVTAEPPLLDVLAPDQAPVTVRVVRTTLVAGKTLLRLRTEGGKDGLPQLDWRAWDALLARHGPQPRGDLVSLPDADDVDKLHWRSMNCVYVGWDKLEAGPFSRVLANSWPPMSLEKTRRVTPDGFNPVDTPAGFAASFGAGPIGCELNRLPTGRSP